jgi:hypothetical protein
MSIGWIKIHRSITEHWLYTEKRKFSKFEAWNDILLNVNFTPGKTIIKGKLININRGESVLSLETWGKRWNWDKSSVKRFLELLKKDEMIELKNETVTTRLIVCKYDTYQSKENADETPVKRKRNADETHAKPIKEEEECKEEKEEKNIPDFQSFLNHALTKEPNIDEVQLRKKYDAWINNDWHNGNGKKIVFWKRDLNSTLPYIEKKKGVIIETEEQMLKRRFAKS